MRPAIVAVLAPLALVASLLLPACGSSPGTGGGGGSPDSGDGMVHPAGNGTRESETDACSALSTAQDTLGTTLMCTGTSRPCPTLIQVQVGGTACLQYDQGSVEGCVAYYNMATTCEALAAAEANCVVTPFAGSEPMGCP